MLLHCESLEQGHSHQFGGGRATSAFSPNHIAGISEPAEQAQQRA
jgi:hypothetical protein